MLNQLIVRTLPIVPKPIVHLVAKRYIAGAKLEDAVRVTRELEAAGAMSTIDVLGEFVSTREMAEAERDTCLSVLQEIDRSRLKSYLSIKPTSFGMGIDFDYGFDNVRMAVQKAGELGLFVRLDMENSPYTSSTLEMYRKLRAAGHDNVGIVLQAYLRRSEKDLRSLLEYKPSVRLCKGIYVEEPSIAFKDKEEIRENYKKLLGIMLDNGLYTCIATHDELLTDYAEKEIDRRSIPWESYEFQMLLGVREDKRAELLHKGHRLRVYVPFGEDWYGYATRRLKENPHMAGQILKSFLGMK